MYRKWIRYFKHTEDSSEGVGIEQRLFCETHDSYAINFIVVRDMICEEDKDIWLLRSTKFKKLLHSFRTLMESIGA